MRVGETMRVADAIDGQDPYHLPEAYNAQYADGQVFRDVLVPFLRANYDKGFMPVMVVSKQTGIPRARLHRIRARHTSSIDSYKHEQWTTARTTLSNGRRVGGHKTSYWVMKLNASLLTTDQTARL